MGKIFLYLLLFLAASASFAGVVESSHVWGEDTIVTISVSAVSSLHRPFWDDYVMYDEQLFTLKDLVWAVVLFDSTGIVIERSEEYGSSAALFKRSESSGALKHLRDLYAESSEVPWKDFSKEDTFFLLAKKHRKDVGRGIKIPPPGTGNLFVQINGETHKVRKAMSVRKNVADLLQHRTSSAMKIAPTIIIGGTDVFAVHGYESGFVPVSLGVFFERLGLIPPSRTQQVSVPLVSR